MLANVLGHSDAGVADRDVRFVAGQGHFDANFAVLRRIADSIVEQDTEEPLEQQLVPFDKDRVARKMPVEEDSAGLGEVFHAAASVDD